MSCSCRDHLRVVAEHALEGKRRADGTPPAILIVSHGGYIKEFMNVVRQRKAGTGAQPPAPFANAAQNTSVRRETHADSMPLYLFLSIARP